MTEDKRPGMIDSEPAGEPALEADVLHRVAREVRASPALAALVPLSSSEREELVDAAIARAMPPGAAPQRAAPARRTGRLARISAGVAVGAGLAAAVALYLHGGEPGPAPLARYAMTVAGEQSARGATATPDGPVEIRPATRLVVRLTASAAERDALLRLVIVRDGRAAVLDPPITRARAGDLEIAGPAAELLGTQRDGPAELVVVIGRALPGDAEVAALAREAPDAQAATARDVQVLRRAVVLAGFSHTAIDVLLGGCRAVVDPPGAAPAPARCAFAVGAPLELWIGVADPGGVTVELDGRDIGRDIGRRAALRDGGAALEIAEPASGVLTVRADGRPIAAWQLAPVAQFDGIAAADAARRAGRLDDAVAALDAIPAGGPPEQQLEIMRRRAKLDRLRGDAVRERERRDAAVALARSLGWISVESDETVAILYSLMDQHALARAAQLLPALDAHGDRYPEGVVRRELVRGLLASELGDLGAALGAFQRALAVADRIADRADRAMILAPLADALQSLGRDGEATALIDAEIERGARDGDVCARVDALTSAGWLLRDSAPARARRLVDAAAELAGERCAVRLPIALVNQGWLLASAGRFAEARAVLGRLAHAPHPGDGRVTSWALRLEAEVVLGEDPASAARHAGRLAADAAALCSSELAYEAELLRARALARLARPSQAAAAFARAERALTLWSRLVPLGEGRETFFARHDALAREAIAFFLDQLTGAAPPAAREARRALAVTVRHSIARFTGSLAGGGRIRALVQRGDGDRDRTSRQFERMRARWPAPLDDEIAPDRGSVDRGVCEARDAAALAAAADRGDGDADPAHAALLVHPAPHGVLVIAWRGSSIELRALARAARPGDRLAADITEAAAPLLAGAPRVQLHVHRALAGLALDRSLAARLGVPIAFAVDAPVHPPAARCTRAPRALLVTNPQGNLWAASAAAPVIRGQLERLGLAVDVLEGPAATRDAVAARLADPCTAVFHYDGHGASGEQRAQAAPGQVIARDRRDDALLLAGGDALTVADVLALPDAPRAVVLNGCTTAAAAGLGLAQAFLLAGASQAIASLDELPADVAARFSRTLFARAPAGRPVDLIRLFHDAPGDGERAGLRAFER